MNCEAFWIRMHVENTIRIWSWLNKVFIEEEVKITSETIYKYIAKAIRTRLDIWLIQTCTTSVICTIYTMHTTSHPHTVAVRTRVEYPQPPV